MNEINKCIVKYQDRVVGTLALTKEKTVAFSYDDEWIHSGFSISPLSLPLEQKVYVPSMNPFQGVFGVFNDSMPDGWGRLLLDRWLSNKEVNPFSLTSLQRLTMVGSSGMGALTYEPAYPVPHFIGELDYDEIALACKHILESQYTEDLDELFLLGGSSGGARPKILTTYKGEDWIIKFPASHDDKNIGENEYRYAECAKQCGVEMSEVNLFPSKRCNGYFGTKRFDRMNSKDGVKRVHMVSVSGMLETSHRIPNLDYKILMKLTQIVTENYDDLLKLYKLMCFNVFAHNRDDHSKNFAFLYDEEKSAWRLAPAYDLTYSNSIGGEHATCINGNGKNPNIQDLLTVAKEAGIKESLAYDIAVEIRKIVKDQLSDLL